MAFQLQVTAVDTISASITSIDNAVNSVKVSPEMIAACGSERSARFAAIASLLNSKEVDKLYTKAVLYSRWKADFKSEKNTLYKSLSELAANCGESRQAFGALSKVGQVFFPADKDAAAIAKRWTERNYSPYILFDLTGLPYNLLDSIAETLTTFDVKENGDFGKITSGQARLIKEAYAACNKNVDKFMNTFMCENSADGNKTWYDGDTFIKRICNYKLYLCIAPDDENSADDNSTGDNSAGSDKDNSDKSGFSNYLFIAPHMERRMIIATDGKESEIINKLATNGYKIISSETNKRGVIRTFINDANDIRIIGVFPLSVKSITVDVDAYNEKVKTDMESKGVGQYFHPFTVPQYVEIVTKDENPLDYIRI